MSTASAIYRLADFAHDLQLKNIPAHVARQGALSILDTMGCMLAGVATSDGALFTQAEKPEDRPGKSSVAGMKTRARSDVAARINGYLGDIFELNDLTGGHASIGIVPAAMALAEENDSTGSELLLACIAGIEIASRLYNAVYPKMKPYNESGMGPVGFPDTVGAAAAAAILLKFDRDQTRAALAIAAGMAGWNPVEATAGPGSTIKALFHGGWPASVALLAAQYAAAGVTGPMNILESRVGYFATVSHGADISAIDTKDWSLSTPRRKLHASCGYTHSALDVVLRLSAQNPALLAQARDIEVRMPPYVMPVVVKDMPPSTPNEARFHTQYLIAVAAHDHAAIAPGHSEKFATYLARPEISDLYRRIRISPEPSLPHYHKGWLRVETKDGRIHDERNDAPKGSPGNPMSDNEVEEKFLALASPIIGAAEAETLKTGIEALETDRNLNALFSLFRGEKLRELKAG